MIKEPWRLSTSESMLGLFCSTKNCFIFCEYLPNSSCKTQNNIENYILYIITIYIYIYIYIYTPIHYPYFTQFSISINTLFSKSILQICCFLLIFVVLFRATLLYDKVTFWTSVTSGQLTFDLDNDGPPTAVMPDVLCGAATGCEDDSDECPDDESNSAGGRLLNGLLFCVVTILSVFTYIL